MSESPLSRYAGPIAVIAGGLFAMAAVGLFLVMDRSDLVAMMTDPVFIVFNAAYAITFPLLLIALVALYWRQAGEAGLFGAVAFCTAATGTMALAGDMWFEGFAVPSLAQVTPGTRPARQQQPADGGLAIQCGPVLPGLDLVRPSVAACQGFSASVVTRRRGRRPDRFPGRDASMGCCTRAGCRSSRGLVDPAGPEAPRVQFRSPSA